MGPWVEAILRHSSKEEYVSGKIFKVGAEGRVQPEENWRPQQRPGQAAVLGEEDRRDLDGSC